MRWTGLEAVNKTLVVLCRTFLDGLNTSDMRLGQNLIKTFLDYYKATGYIAAKPDAKTAGNRRDSGMATRTASEPLRDDYRFALTIRVQLAF
jgi:hypothetical protein